MNYAMRYRGVVVEDVPGAPWMAAWGWRGAGHKHFALMRALPGYASDELRLACLDSLVADVFGVCDLCGAVAPTPPQMKTAPPGENTLSFVPLPHRDGCPCADDQLRWLDIRDSPDGFGTPADFSEESTDALAAYVNEVLGQSVPS